MRNNKTKVSIILVTVFMLFFSSIAYGQDVTAKLDTLEDNFNYMTLMMKYIENIYKFDAKQDELIQGAMKGIFDTLDRHSTYFSPEEYKDFNVNTNGQFGGIGVSIAMRNDNLTVITPLKGTPAQKAGIMSGDIIVSVDGVDITDFSPDKSVNMLRGEKGSKVTIGVIRESSSTIQYFELVRDIIKVNPLTSEIVDGDIGVITLEGFNQNTNENVVKAMKEFEEKGVKGFIIDLRSNPGGSLSEVIRVADYFIDREQPIVHINYKGDAKTTYSAQLDKIGLPLVVLVNGYSASASEIFAGAIQDNKAGTIIGTQTYGKGTVQKLIELTNGGAMKVTVAEYLTPNENKIDGVGLTPDIVISNPKSDKINEINDFVPMIEFVNSKLNDRGLNIYGAQQRLHFLGYSAKATGVMDQETLNTINLFQEKHGLKVTDTLDAETRAQINQSVREILYSGTKDKQMAKAIEVISEQIEN